MQFALYILNPMTEKKKSQRREKTSFVEQILITTLGNMWIVVWRMYIMLTLRLRPLSPNIHIQVLQTDPHTFP